MNLYEIYTTNPTTGQRGWDIEFIVALDREDAATYPNFDIVIGREGTFTDKTQALGSGYPLTDRVKAVLGV